MDFFLSTSFGALPFLVPSTTSPRMECSILHHCHFPALTTPLPRSGVKGTHHIAQSHALPATLQRAPFLVRPSPQPIFIAS